MKKVVALLFLLTIFVSCRQAEIELNRSERILYTSIYWNVIQLNDSIFVVLPNSTNQSPIFFKNTTNLDSLNRDISPIIKTKKIKDSEITIKK
jgi:hypothetical protein